MNRNEHLKLASTYFNIAAGGTFVGAVLTVPINAATSGKIEPGAAFGLVMVFLIGSFFLHGVAQAILALVKP